MPPLTGTPLPPAPSTNAEHVVRDKIQARIEKAAEEDPKLIGWSCLDLEMREILLNRTLELQREENPTKVRPASTKNIF